MFRATVPEGYAVTAAPDNLPVTAAAHEPLFEFVGQEAHTMSVVAVPASVAYLPTGQ